MRLLPNLQFEQDILRELASQYDPDMSSAGKKNHVVEMCRLATAAGQVRAELAYPWCIGRVPGMLVDQARIQLDLARVLIREVMVTDPTDFSFDALVITMSEQMERLSRIEELRDGLWAAAVAGGLDPSALDIAIGERLRDLDRQSRSGNWKALDPEYLETLMP